MQNVEKKDDTHTNFQLCFSNECIHFCLDPRLPNDSMLLNLTIDTVGKSQIRLSSFIPRTFHMLFFNCYVSIYCCVSLKKLSYFICNPFQFFCQVLMTVQQIMEDVLTFVQQHLAMLFAHAEMVLVFQMID